MFCVRVVSAGGEGKCKGCKAVDFEQETRVDGTFATMKEGLPSQVNGYLILINRKSAPILNVCMCLNLKEFSVQVKNKPNVEIRNMHLFLVQESSW
jgi:hypothetical protein